MAMASFMKLNRLMLALKSVQKASSPIHGQSFLRRFHGQYGIAEGAVSHLTNSSNGAELYLVGSCHVLDSSAQLVKKVIGMVEPNMVAVELCRKRAHAIKKSNSEIKTLFQLFSAAMRAQGGILEKFITFLFGFQHRQLRALGIFPGKEFEVAMEESERQGAQLVLIDDSISVTGRKLCYALRKIADDGYFVLIKKVSRFMDEIDKLQLDGNIELVYNRIAARALIHLLKTEFPEIASVLITDRDRLMFERLRPLTGKVVGVVGMGHMDGIEEFWKQAEQSYIRSTVHQEDGQR